MNIFDFILLGIALGFDCFAVSLGMILGDNRYKAGSAGQNVSISLLRDCVLLALLMGVFQSVMPLITYGLGMLFESVISSVLHWIACGLLTVLGIRMIVNKDETQANGYGWGEMLLMGVATSIDALACGVLLVGSDMVLPAITVIGLCSVIMSLSGSAAGRYLGRKLPMRADWIGGVILIGIGIKIVISHYLS